MAARTGHQLLALIRPEFRDKVLLFAGKSRFIGQ